MHLRDGKEFESRPASEADPEEMPASTESQSSPNFVAAVESLAAAVDRLHVRDTSDQPPSRHIGQERPFKFAGDRKQFRLWKKLVQLYLLDCPKLSPAQLGRIVGSLTEGPAREVYLALLDTVEPTDLTPTQVLDALSKAFSNITEEAEARNEWDELSQGQQSVLEFANAMRRVAATPGLEDIRSSDKAMQHRFRKGLARSISNKLTLETFTSFESLLEAALKIEQKLGKSQTGLNALKDIAPPRQPRQSKPYPRQGRQDRSQPSKLRKYVPPHSRQDYGLPVAGIDGTMRARDQCRACRQYGHWAVHCPQQRQQENSRAR